LNGERVSIDCSRYSFHYRVVLLFCGLRPFFFLNVVMVFRCVLKWEGGLVEEKGGLCCHYVHMTYAPTNLHTACLEYLVAFLTVEHMATVMLLPEHILLYI
jgi:hypothetical protein